MLYRPVDSDGDMRPVASQSQMLEGVYAVLAAVNSRLRLLYGEWWEDRELGFLVPQFLFDGLRMKNGPELLAGYITAYLKDTPGVVAISEVNVTVNGHTLRYSCCIITEYGQTEEVVSQDVLLRALP